MLKFECDVASNKELTDCIVQDVVDGYETEVTVFEALPKFWNGGFGITDGKGTVFLCKRSLLAHGEFTNVLARLKDVYGVRVKRVL